MSKVLLTHSYFLKFDPKQHAQFQPYPPLGTIYAAAVLREAGHEVALFDTMLASSADKLIPQLEKHKPSVLVIYDDGFNYLTKMCLTNMREAAFEMIRLASRRNCRIIVNSSDSADHFDKYLDCGAEFIVTGEGEITLRALLARMEEGTGRYEDIEGIIFRKAGQTIQNPKRPVMSELDELPMPAWDLVDIEAYRKCWIKSTGYFSLNISTTRGCPFKCNWCAKPIYGNRYNVHSPSRVVRELKMLKERYRVDHFWMTDDIFGLKPGWIKEFNELVQAESLSLRYKIQSRVDLLLQENNIASLAQSGCEITWIGAESGSQKILDAMDKGTTVQQIRQATTLLKRHGVGVAFFLQFGYPGEDASDIRKTIDLVMELMPDDIGVSVSYPLPGTKFYERVKNELSEKANWSDSDELALMFRNTFPSPFYKELQRYLHRRFRSRQGLATLKKMLRHPSLLSGSAISQIGKVPVHWAGSRLHARRLKKFQA